MMPDKFTILLRETLVSAHGVLAIVSVYFRAGRLCTKNTSWALIERPYSCAPQAVGAVYDRPGFFVQSRLTASWHSNDESCSAGTTGKPRRPQICAGLSRPGNETRPCRDSREGSLLQLPRRVHCTWHARDQGSVAHDHRTRYG